MTAGELRSLIESLAGLPYGGEPVDQLTHARQAAALAQADGADDDLVLATLLHDIGRADSVAETYPGLGHDAAGEEFCRELLGDRIAWLQPRAGQAISGRHRHFVVAFLTSASVRSASRQRVAHSRESAKAGVLSSFAIKLNARTPASDLRSLSR